MSKKSHDITEAKKCLEEFNVYDQTMSDEEILKIYQDLKKSGDTKNQSNEISSEDSEDVFTETLLFKSKQWSEQRQLGIIQKRTRSRKDSDIVVLPSIDEVSTIPTTPKRGRLQKDVKKDKLASIDVYSVGTNKCKTLEIIHHTPKTNGPYYCHSSLQSLTLKEKAKRIAAYHVALAKEFEKVSRKSLNFAPWCDPIPANGKFNIFQDKKTEISTNDFLQEVDSINVSEELYISRGGRHTKRKTYIEDGLEEQSEKKKAKSDKSFQPSNAKKLSNSEIMNRSSLFADSPKMSRTEKIITNSIDEIKKREKSEAEIKRFEKSLDNSPENEDFELKVTSSHFPMNDDGKVTFIDADEPDFQKIKVINAVSGRKGYRRNQSYQTVNASASTSGISPMKIPVKTETKAEVNKRYKGPKDAKKKTTRCPICSIEFLQTDIEEHASTCGLTAEMEIQNDLPNQEITGTNTITCSICDRVFILNTDYEVHVKKCIKDSKSK